MLLLALGAGGWAIVAAVAAGAATLAVSYLLSGLFGDVNPLERRRKMRQQDYRAFLTSVNESVHRISTLCGTPYGERAGDRQAAASFLDTEVTPHVKAIQLIAKPEEPVVKAVLELHTRLQEFRDAITTTAAPPDCSTPEYRAKYYPVVRARDRFIEAAGI